MITWEGLELPTLDGFTGFVPPQGDGTSHVMIMGEAPGEQEARDSIPFHPNAPAGSTLNRLLRRAGLEREKFILTNTVWSRPPGNYLEGAKYEGQAIAAYAPFRERAFELYRPRVIIAMGGTALRALTAWGGKGAGITQCQGYVLDGPWDGTYVVPALHPSAIMRGEQRMSGVVIWALQRALEIAKNGFTRQTTRYVAHPTLADALAFERDYNPERHTLSYDIETPETGSLDEEEVEDKDEDITYTIIRVSLCYDAQTGYAISVPWTHPYIELVRRMLSSSGPKRVWNGNFDNPRLQANQTPVLGRIFDSMWAWKHLQPTLPRSLGFVAPFYNWSWEPWKNSSLSEPEVYSCKDAHALQLIGDGVDAHLKQKGQWEVYECHVVELSEVLHTMSQNGLPYSAEKAHAFELELQAKWDSRYAELQRVIPDELKPSKQKQGYKKVPADTTGLTQRLFSVLGSDMTAPEVDRLRAASGQFVDGVIEYDIYRVVRWCKLEPFLPTSTQQVQALLKYHNLPVGKNRKTKSDSADDEHLRKMIKRTRSIKKHAQLTLTLQMIRECKQLSKVLGTYVKGWRPGADGRIHATPGFWGKMYRVSWRRPNISATIQDKLEDSIAQGFRKCVAVPAGRLLLESDWKGIEAVLVGWFAGDADYTRLARLGVHDYMGIHMAGGTVDLSLPDDTLKVLFRDFKREHPKLRDDAKHTVHGTNYGMGPRLMADLYEMPEREAKRLQALYFDLFPKVRKWQLSVLDRASRECKLTNPFTYSMPFWEVHRWDSKRQVWALGEDAKSAIAFLPRDTAAAMLKEVLLRLKYLADEGTMLASTHDSITCEVDEADLMRVATILKTEMERGVPELGGLSIGVELKYGRAWHDDELQSLDLTSSQPVEEQAVAPEWSAVPAP